MEKRVGNYNSFFFYYRIVEEYYINIDFPWCKKECSPSAHFFFNRKYFF